MITYLYNKVQAKLLKTYLQENSTTHTFKLLNGIQLHRYLLKPNWRNLIGSYTKIGRGSGTVGREAMVGTN